MYTVLISMQLFLLWACSRPATEASREDTPDNTVTSVETSDVLLYYTIELSLLIRPSFTLLFRPC